MSFHVSKPKTRVLVYEYLTGGGLYSRRYATGEVASLVAEGQSMAEAVCTDLNRIAGVEVVRMVDARLPLAHLPYRYVTVGSSQEETDALSTWSRRADWTLLVAPETGQRLVRRCELVERSGGRLLSPDAQFVALAGDKCATAGLLGQHAISTPFGVCVPALTTLPRDFPYPALLKPCDGAGSVATYRVTSFEQFDAHLAGTPSMRLEQWVDGKPVSVAALTGPRARRCLPACGQRISDDGLCRYLGGSTPLHAPLAGRATRLAAAVLEALPDTNGYVGIDMILGADAGGADDVVLEVNPRLTTSYVGLRQRAVTNLAEAMLNIAAGGDAELQFQGGRIEFDIHGSQLNRSSARE